LEHLIFGEFNHISPDTSLYTIYKRWDVDLNELLLILEKNKIQPYLPFSECCLIHKESKVLRGEEYYGVNRFLWGEADCVDSDYFGKYDVNLSIPAIDAGSPSIDFGDTSGRSSLSSSLGWANWIGCVMVGMDSMNNNDSIPNSLYPVILSDNGEFLTDKMLFPVTDVFVSGEEVEKYELDNHYARSDDSNLLTRFYPGIPKKQTDGSQYIIPILEGLLDKARKPPMTKEVWGRLLAKAEQDSSLQVVEKDGKKCIKGFGNAMGEYGLKNLTDTLNRWKKPIKRRF